uniref:Uncharacterized protein n=1 Tax=Podospora anserina (strain S / ATCC MYA-4624 / DSM 980 / FGSC 10383) TaxID=515849 RepID=A0A090CPD4_PODAN|nr:Putative protein of unknown function [Podospora anserina S mat+]
MDGLTNNTPLSASSMSRSTQEHHHSPAPTPGSSVDPPRPPKDGYDQSATPPNGKGSPDLKIWRRRRRSRPSGSGGQDSESHTASPKTYPPVPPIPLQTAQSPYLSEWAHVYSLQKPHESSSNTIEQEGEWLAPKGRGFFPSLPTIVPAAEVKPEPGLKKRSESSEQAPVDDGKFDAVKKYLDRLPEAEKPVPEQKTDVEPNTKGRRVRFGRVLWHRRRSTRATDNSNPSLSDVDRKERPSGPAIWLTQFPGGEATRVHTPPYKEDTVDGRPRSLFFDVARPNSRHDQTPSETSSTREKVGIRTSRSSPLNVKSRGRRSQQRSSASGASGRGLGGSISPYRVPSPRKAKEDSSPSRSKSGPAKTREKTRSPLATTPKESVKEWWDAPLRTPDTPPSTPTPRTRVTRATTGTAAMFKFDVPEHLPSSPMCPANPKNPKSLGKGVCVVSFESRERGSSADQGNSIMGDDGVHVLGWRGRILCFLRRLRGRRRLMMMGVILCNA